MPFARVAIAVAVIAPALAAQQAPRESVRAAAPSDASLTAEVHYSTAGDAWFSTNKPAYVALFDVSRGGVSQLYPTFTAQATELSGTSVRVDLRSAQAASGRSSLVSLDAPVASMSADGWPHTLLLVASTMPLRIGNSWSSNIAINNSLVRDHQWNELDTDAGIALLVKLVRPLDWGAEVATDRTQLATPARYASSLAYDPNKLAVGYSCVDASRQFISPTPQLGASCVALREFPASAYMLNASRTPAPAGTTDTTRGTPLQARGTPVGPAAPRISEQKHRDVQSISDPAEIRKFMESMKARQEIHGAAGGTPRVEHQREARPRISEQARPQGPAQRATGSRAEPHPSAPPAPNKPRNERD